jgi:hypothetical protein
LDTASYGTLYDSNVTTTPYTNTNYLMININQNPLLRSFFNINQDINTTALWLEAFPLNVYDNTSGGTVFSGLQYSIFDHWA